MDRKISLVWGFGVAFGRPTMLASKAPLEGLGHVLGFGTWAKVDHARLESARIGDEGAVLATMVLHPLVNLGEPPD
jgi:hypothetical protein